MSGEKLELDMSKNDILTVNELDTGLTSITGDSDDGTHLQLTNFVLILLGGKLFKEGECVENNYHIVATMTPEGLKGLLTSLDATLNDWRENMEKREGNNVQNV